jgi:hypothetical protein
MHMILSIELHEMPPKCSLYSSTAQQVTSYREVLNSANYPPSATPLVFERLSPPRPVLFPRYLILTYVGT